MSKVSDMVTQIRMLESELHAFMHSTPDQQETTIEALELELASLADEIDGGYGDATGQLLDEAQEYVDNYLYGERFPRWAVVKLDGKHVPRLTILAPRDMVVSHASHITMAWQRCHSSNSLLFR